MHPHRPSGHITLTHVCGRGMYGCFTVSDSPVQTGSSHPDTAALLILVGVTLNVMHRNGPCNMADVSLAEMQTYTATHFALRHTVAYWDAPVDLSWPTAPGAFAPPHCGHSRMSHFRIRVREHQCNVVNGPTGRYGLLQSDSSSPRNNVSHPILSLRLPRASH